MNLVTKGLSYQPSNGKVCQKYKCDHHCDMNLCWDIVSLTNKILAGNFCSRQVTVAHILAILADRCLGSGHQVMISQPHNVLAMLPH